MSWTAGTLNLNGIRSANRRGFRAWFERAAPDVLMLQELRMQRPQMEAEHLPPDGWHHVQVDAEKKGYAGSSIWSRLPAERVAVGVGLDWADLEGRVVRMDLGPATAFSVYQPSGSSGEERQALKEVFMEHLLDTSRGWLAEGRPILVGGDFNIAHAEIDIHDPRGNAKNSGFLPRERAWVDRLLALGWVDLFRALNPDSRVYSWWSNRGQARANNKGWRLDYLFASPQLAEKAEKVWIEPYADLSDHAPVMARFRD